MSAFRVQCIVQFGKFTNLEKLVDLCSRCEININYNEPNSSDTVLRSTKLTYFLVYMWWFGGSSRARTFIERIVGQTANRLGELLKQVLDVLSHSKTEGPKYKDKVCEVKCGLMGDGAMMQTAHLTEDVCL